MIDLGQHAEFIIWGYVGVAVAIIALIGWTLWDSRRVAAKLQRLEEQGIRRRSSGTST